MPYSRLLLAFALTAPLATSQVTATYDTFGAGCPGTGIGLSGRTLLPAAATTSWGGGNAIPLGWTPNRYQQVFSGTELPNAFTMAGLSLRQPHTGPTAHNFTVDVEIAGQRVCSATLGGSLVVQRCLRATERSALR